MERKMSKENINKLIDEVAETLKMGINFGYVKYYEDGLLFEEYGDDVINEFDDYGISCAIGWLMELREEKRRDIKNIIGLPKEIYEIFDEMTKFNYKFVGFTIGTETNGLYNIVSLLGEDSDVNVDIHYTTEIVMGDILEEKEVTLVIRDGKHRKFKFKTLTEIKTAIISDEEIKKLLY